ncbi:hypothetical protein [Sulfurimonas marina]|uniref:Helix-turn-helix domain-containing protein n=1 Tax=Sulfurimonas marina TaxID=2590551 RepID=A0A7M1AUG1_9BACT|nr:hypothetical protein [Sulfurimonas marina]QOP41055.1 hypothetical protein FJR03_04590 [Sulfurimonas marina]
MSKRNDGFTQIENSIVNYPKISFKAKGILMYMKSKPKTWKFYINDILKHTSDKRDAVRSGIQELIDVGYVTKEEKRNDKGQFEYIYKIHPNRDGKTVTENPIREIQCGKTVTENPILSNTNTIKTKRSNTNSTIKRLPFDVFKDIFINEFQNGFNGHDVGVIQLPLSNSTYKMGTVFKIKNGLLLNTTSGKFLEKDEALELWALLQDRFHENKIPKLQNIQV